MLGRKLRPLLEKLGIDRPEAFSWVMYDWANSAVYTTIVVAVFPVYFLKVAASEAVDTAVAQVWFSRATALALLAIALLAPFLGAIADVRAAKKRFLFGFATIGILATTGMCLIGYGDWQEALWLFALVNIGVAGSVVFYDSLLPHIARPGEEDRLSTTGFAFGYVGGGLLLVLNFAWISHPEWFGLPSGEDLDADQRTLPSRLAFLSVGVWWALFSIPLLRKVKEPALGPASPLAAGSGTFRLAFGRLRGTLRDLKRYRQTLLLLVAILIYSDGIGTILRMASIYAKGKDLDDGTIILTLLLVQFVGVPCAILFGVLAGRFGAKRMVLVGLSVYVAVCVFAYFMSTNTHFVLLGIAVGAVQGGCQALSRSLFAAMTPKHKSGEFFAFFSWAEKFAGLFGPLLFGLAIQLTSSPQNAILTIIPFFLVGGFLLLRVDVEEGCRAARQAEADYSRKNGLDQAVPRST